MSNQNNIDELIPQSEIENSKQLNEQFKIMKGLVIDIIKESKGNRLGAFDGKSLNDAVKAQQAATQATNELGLTTRTYNNLKKITNELEQVGKDTIEEAQLLVRKMTIERNNLNLKTQDGAVRQKELNKQIDEFNNLIKNNKDALSQQRMNIGNYAGALSGLQFNMTQVIRELPSLATGLNNFAVAIGNNLPQVASDIQRIIALNKELQAEGKPTVSVFSTLATSIFSWQTALIVGLTMLPKLISMISESGKEAEEAATKLDKLTASIKKQADETINWGKIITDSNDDGSKAQQRYIDVLNAKGEGHAKVYQATKKLRDLELAEVRSEIQVYNDRQEAGVSFQDKILELKEKEKDILNKIDTDRYAFEKNMLEEGNKNFERYLEVRRAGVAALKKLLDDEMKANAGADSTDALGYRHDEEQALRTLIDTYEKLHAIKMENSGVMDGSSHNAGVLPEGEAALLNASLEANRAHNKMILDDEKKTAQERIKIAKEVADSKRALEAQVAEAIIALGDIMLESDSKFLDEKQKNAQNNKDQQLAFIESLNVSDQRRRDLKYAAEKEAFTAEKQLDNERQAIEKRKFALNQAQALAEILFNTQKAVAAVQAEAAVLAATPATAALAASAYAQIPQIYISAAISAGLIGAKILSYGDGTPVGGHPGGAAEVAERGKPEWYRPSPNSPWQLITDHTVFPNMPTGAEVIPMDKASDGMLTPKLSRRVASIGGINMMPLIKSMNDVKQAVDRKPVPVFNISRGAIQEAVIMGNDRIYRLRRNIND